MNSNAMYFSLRDPIYAARFDSSIIILDSETDAYLSIIDDAAHYLSAILQHSFTKDGGGEYQINAEGFDHQELHFWIAHFCERRLIVQSATRNMKPIAQPLKEGGLCDYQWDTKPAWNPLGRVPVWHTIKAWIMLARVHRTMKRSGTQGLLNLIRACSAPHASQRQPTDQEIAALASVVDAASVLYPKKTFCLAWATVYVCLSLKQGWTAQLVIGVQTNPFYAHAWAESKGKVVHDDPEIARVLSIILKTPLSQGA